MFCSRIKVQYFYNPGALSKYSKQEKLFSIFNYLAQFRFPDLSLSPPHLLPLGLFMMQGFIKVEFQRQVICLSIHLITFSINVEPLGP